jgi:putative spermidine/putrescine transport system ATP-binding protein
VWRAGEDITQLPSWRRGLGVVFQSYALFPHMTVAENVGFPLRMRRWPTAQAREAVARALAQVRLSDYADRLPRALSGGQQQRVAVARAIVFAPSVVLMDEPLGALDKRLRDELKAEIRRLHQELSATIVYVTHDQDEAMALSDRICVMNRARVAQVGTPAAIYARPASRFVAEFLGRSNILAVEHADGCRLRAGGVALRAAVPARPGDLVLLRPERIAVADGPNPLAGIVTDILDLGGTREMSVRLAAGPSLQITTLGGAPRPAIGDRMTLSIAPEDVVPLPAEAP